LGLRLRHDMLPRQILSRYWRNGKSNNKFGLLASLV
jgi:hypothetical protein